MLNKEEERRLASFLDCTASDLAKDVTYASEYYITAVRWLAIKLKETNDHLNSLVKCNGKERHRHYNLKTDEFIMHEHSHTRQAGDMEPLQHHSLYEHDRENREERTHTEYVTTEKLFKKN